MCVAPCRVFYLLQVVVVKGSGTVVQELFASNIAKLIGVTTPAMRMAAYTQQEWRNMKTHMRRVAKPEHL